MVHGVKLDTLDMHDDFKTDVGPYVYFNLLCLSLRSVVQGRLSPRNMAQFPPHQGAVLRDDHGVSSPQSACPHTVPKRKFVEYNWTSAIKIKLFYT